jgi:hypothetical protein
MSNSYIPSKDGDLEAWLANFKTLIAASPTSYGLVASDATAVTNAYNAWHTAYLAAVNPTTRTKLTVAAKNQQKAIVLGVVRGYAATIRANAAVSDSLKGGLGLHVRDTTPTPVPPPSTFPTLIITEPMRGLQDLNAHDSTTPNKRAKPSGTAGILLFRAIGATAATDQAEADFLSFVSRTEFKATFDPADNGKTATYFARWTNSKGEVGPWGPAASMPIAA